MISHAGAAGSGPATHFGHLIEEDGITYLARSDNHDPDNVMASLQAAGTWRIAAGRGASCCRWWQELAMTDATLFIDLQVDFFSSHSRLI